MAAQQYIKKPDRVLAMQFTGGETNGPEIVNWIVAEGGMAVWLDALESTELEPGRNEQIRISGDTGPEIALITDYIVKLGHGKFCIRSTVEFHDQYAQA